MSPLQYRTVRPLGPRDMGHGTGMMPLDPGQRPQAPLQPLDLSSRNGQPMRPAQDLTGLNAVSNPSDRTTLQKQAETFVATAFYGTLLKQMRNSPFKSELFSGGRGGEAFGTLYDQELAQRMAHGAGGKLAHSIVRTLEAKKEYDRQLRAGRQLRQRGAADEKESWPALDAPSFGARAADATMTSGRTHAIAA